ncbi:MAG: hypothetical protein ACRD0D_04785, partial [Acidimicrobiales bacterium]
MDDLASGIEERRSTMPCGGRSGGCGRRPRFPSRSALLWPDRTCRVEGCDRPVAEWGHHRDWARTHHIRLVAPDRPDPPA